VGFVAITLFVASQRVFIVVSVYFVIYSVRKLLGIQSYSSSDDYVNLAENENFSRPPLFFFFLENYICDVGQNTKIWNNSQNSV